MKEILKKHFHINVITLIISILFIVSLIYNYINIKTSISDFYTYMSQVKTIESLVIKSIPIYSDFATPQQENLLRTYLFSDHQKVAKIYGLPPVESDSEMLEKIKQGSLINVDADSNSLYYFYNVPAKYRFLTASSASCLILISERFQKNLNQRASLPPVKIAISSAFRTGEYQKIISKKNFNAVPGSTHSCGISFDIFFDDYYVCLPDPESRSYISRIVLSKLRRDLGFLMGDALRRQFRSILMETLIQLQKEKSIYAIMEKQQHCYHITSLIKI